MHSAVVEHYRHLVRCCARSGRVARPRHFARVKSNVPSSKARALDHCNGEFLKHFIDFCNFSKLSAFAEEKEFKTGQNLLSQQKSSAIFIQRPSSSLTISLLSQI